jgi:hypothetical protein
VSPDKTPPSAQKSPIETIRHSHELVCSELPKGLNTNPRQENTDLATSVDGSCLAAQLADFAEDTNGLVGELFEVGGGDTGSCFGHDGKVFAPEVCAVWWFSDLCWVDEVARVWGKTRGRVK